MERRLTEEEVTKNVLSALLKLEWSIICFDFPQSGTGKQLHPNGAKSKTEGIWVPDIVALKNKTLLCFENKDHFEQSDVQKLNDIKTTSRYSDALFRLLNGEEFSKVIYGIALPWSKHSECRAKEALKLIDCAILLKSDESFLELGRKVLR